MAQRATLHVRVITATSTIFDGEADMVLGGTVATLFMDVRCHEVTVLEKYNTELDPGLFDTHPPEGYTELKLMDFLSGNFGRAN